MGVSISTFSREYQIQLALFCSIDSLCEIGRDLKVPLNEPLSLPENFVDLHPRTIAKIETLFEMACKNIEDDISLDLSRKLAGRLFLLFPFADQLRSPEREEKMKVFEVLVQVIQPSYQDDFNRLQENPSDEEMDTFLKGIMQEDFYKKLPLMGMNFLRGAVQRGLPENIARSVQNIAGRFFSDFTDQSDGKSLEDFEQMESEIRPDSEVVQEYLLSQVKASSIEEYAARSSRERAEQFLREHLEREYIDIDTLLKILSRKGSAQTLVSCVREDLVRFKQEGTESVFLNVFDQFIYDYVSKSPSGVWRTRAQKNFGYRLRSLDDILSLYATRTSEGEFLLKRVEVSQLILGYLNEVFKCFAHGEKTIEFLRNHFDVILFCDTEILFNCANSDESVGFDKNPHSVFSSYDLATLTGFLRALVKRARDSLKEDSSMHKLLEKMYSFGFFNIGLMSRFANPPTLESLRIVLTPEQIELRKKLFTVLEASWKLCVQYAQRLEKKGQSEEEVKGLPVLGIGFSGPLFDALSGSKENKVFLNFTSALRSRETVITGTSFLYALDFLMTHDGIKLKELPYQLEILEHVNAQDHEVMNYITERILDFLWDEGAREGMNEEVIENLKVFICQRVSEVTSSFEDQKQSIVKKIKEWEEKRDRDQEALNLQQRKLNDCQSTAEEKKIKGIIKSKTTSITEKDKHISELQGKLPGIEEKKQFHESIVKKISNNDFSLLTQEEKDEVERVVEQGKTRVCVETVISRLAGNPYTFSFAMGTTATEAISYEEESKESFFSLEGRTMIKPCETRCQIFSIAHTLWGDLNHFPDVSHAHERDVLHGGQGILPFSYFKG